MEDTEALGATLARRLAGGDVVLLYGELGAGKTAFVRGLARGLGVDDEDVSSPTFVILTSHRGSRLTLHHADLYRLAGAQAGELGLEELPGPDGVLAIEWAERLAVIPWIRTVRVRLEHAEGDERRVTIEDDEARG